MVRLTSFDLYPKTLKEFKQRTLTGAIVSVACAALIAILTVVEIADYAQVRTHDHLSVDISRGQQMRIDGVSEHSASRTRSRAESVGDPTR